MKKLVILVLFPLMIFSQESTLIGDVDCNGQINSEDASLILQFVTNVIDSLPCEENMTGLTPEQLQEMINMMNEQLSINYSGSSSGNNYPTMISNISSEEMVWGDALIYCADLEEDGCSDWFLPNLDQLAYAVSGGCELPDERTSESLWTTTVHAYYDSYIVSLNESGSGGLQASYGGNNEYCRCVRFGEGETDEGSSNSSSISSLVSGSSEQPITMIGPMYRQDEYPDFMSYYLDQYPNNVSNSVYYLDAIKFCQQLSYDNYDDWHIPSYNQIQNYLKESPAELVISNLIEEGALEFWTYLEDLDISGNSGYPYITTVLITGSSNSYPNQAIYFDRSDSRYGGPSCFCVR